MEHAIKRIEERLATIEAQLGFLRAVVLTTSHRTVEIQNTLRSLVRAETAELHAEAKELQILQGLAHPAIDKLHLAFTGVIDKPAPQVLGAKGVEGGKVMAPAALPPDLEKRLAVVADPAFQRYCQTACDHGMDEGEHPVRQAGRVILSICCVSTPYALAEPEPASRLNAMLERFEAWRASLV
jgi:hypothetical protein